MGKMLQTRVDDDIGAAWDKACESVGMSTYAVLQHLVKKFIEKPEIHIKGVKQRATP